MADINNFAINITLCGIYNPYKLRLLTTEEVGEDFFDPNSKINLKETCYLLYIEFESNDPSNIDWYVLTTHDTSYNPDYQHTTSKGQREFYFRLENRIPFEKLRINGLKTLPSGPDMFTPNTGLVGRSELIVKYLYPDYKSSII